MRLLKEPLVHFLALGAAIFALFNWIGERAGGAEAALAREEIVITKGAIRSLTEQFAKTWNRPPAAEELEGLIADHIREEILYREALALGLDRDDTIVRRRMRQKLEFLSEDLLALPEPSEEDLVAYFEAHPGAFRSDSTLTFKHVFLNADKRGDAVASDA
jgi:hypothetical protein